MNHPFAAQAECDAALLEHAKAAAAWELLSDSFDGEAGDDADATAAKVNDWRTKAKRERDKMRRKPHEVLGLDRATATGDEVKKAYRRMSIKWHPDRHAAASDEHKHRAHLQFQRISAANDALEKRAANPYAAPRDAYAYSRRWARRDDDDDDDDDEEEEEEEEEAEDDDDAEASFARARRAWGSSREPSDSWSQYFDSKRRR